MSREDLLRSFIDKSAQGLEIGPSYSPIAARRLGYRVDVLDHLDAQGLRAKYAGEPNVDASLIEEVDFVWSGKSLSQTVGQQAVYDYIVASHVIEHTPNFLGFLSECSLLLKPAGRLILAVPDMRRCFDVFRPLTSLGAVLQADHEKRTRHTAATAADHVAYMAILNGSAGWTRGDQGGFSFVHDLAVADAVFERSLIDAEYYDFHAWVFTPSSFRLLLSDLHALGKTDLAEVEFHPTDGIEFITVLAKQAGAALPPRSELARATRRELLEFPDEPQAPAPCQTSSTT